MSATEEIVGERWSWPVCSGPVVVALGEHDDLAGVAEHAVAAARGRRTRLSIVAVAPSAPIGMAVSPHAMPVTIESVCDASVERLARHLARLRAAVPVDVAFDHRIELGSPSRILARAVARQTPTAIVLGSLLDHRGVARVIARSCRLGTDVHIAARRSTGLAAARGATAITEVSR